MNLSISPEIAINLPAEELAGYIVQSLKSGQDKFHPHNICLSLGERHSNHPQRYEFLIAIMEAFGWMYSEGLCIYDPGDGYNGWMRLSRRAQLLQNPKDVLTLGHREILPKRFLHPTIAQAVSSSFFAGKFDTAVFDAFKEVEIAVRDASGLSGVGAALMMEAFKAGGPLFDKDADANEEEGLRFVFAGAFKVFRNSTGHRNVQMDAESAAALIIHASYLLGIVVDRKQRLKPT